MGAELADPQPNSRVKSLSTCGWGPQSPASVTVPSPIPAFLDPQATGSPLPSHLSLGQSFQLPRQLLHVGLHYRLLDLREDRRHQEG